MEGVQYNQKVEDKMVNAMQSALVDTAQLFITLVITLMKSEDGIDTGELVNSIGSRIMSGGNVVEVYSRTAQAVIMEFGRRPLQKRPPISSLVGRASRKGIISYGKNSVEGLSSKDKGILYVMAKSIGEKGIAPRHYFQRTYDANKDRLFIYYKERFILYMK